MGLLDVTRELKRRYFFTIGVPGNSFFLKPWGMGRKGHERNTSEGKEKAKYPTCSDFTFYKRYSDHFILPQRYV